MTEPAFVTAKRKTGNAKDYRGDVNVSLGDETVTFKHRLLTETEFERLQHALDTESLADSEVDSDVPDEAVDPEMGETEAQERLLELQEKSDLTDEEESELEELSQKVASQTSQIKEALGEDGFALLREMGRETIKPDDESVDYVYNLTTEDPNQAKQLMGINNLPNPMTKDVVRDHLEDQLEEMVTGQPYPIKLNVGLQAMAETISVLGNGLQQ